MDRIYSLKALSREIGLNYHTLRRWCRTGRITHSRTPAGSFASPSRRFANYFGRWSKAVKTLLPRLLVGDETADRLKCLAEEHGVSVGVVIADILEARFDQEPRPDNEIAHRLILVGERFGLGVGGAAAYPSDWERVGGLTPAECRDLAARFVAWRRNAMNHNKLEAIRKKLLAFRQVSEWATVHGFDAFELKMVWDDLVEELIEISSGSSDSPPQRRGNPVPPRRGSGATGVDAPLLQ